MHALQWDQICAWRLAQHQLGARASNGQLLDVVAQICGLHAQLMSAAALALWARVEGVATDTLDKALVQARTLVKTWAMRGTLHLLPANDYPLYVAARGVHPQRRPPSWYTYHGVTPAELEAILEGVPAVLNDTAITREALADAVAQRTKTPKLRELLRSGWGALLKPSAFRGELCFGPPQGQNVTFVHPQRWLGAWEAVDPNEALQTMARKYLAAYGPARAEDLGRWWGIDPGQAKRLLRALGDDVQPVNVEGWEAWALAGTIPQMQKIKAADSVRLLPNFDPYVVGLSRDCEYVLPAAFKARIHRPQGWISPVVLVDGRMAGVWEYEKQRRQLVVKVEMFASPTGRVKERIEIEAKHLGNHLNADLQLKYA